jgi:DNA-binding HxlR family transcriptional regulator
VPSGEGKARDANSKGHPVVKFLQETEHYEGGARLKNGPRDLHRQGGQLRRHVGSVSQRMLTRTLRNLESTGLIARRVTRSKAIAVEYSLTRLGRTLIAPLRGMCRWAKRYRKGVTADVYLSQAHPAQ